MTADDLEGTAPPLGSSWLDVVPNKALRRSDLPGPDASEVELNEFALTFDGYEELGHARCGRIANEALAKWERTGRLPTTLDRLRGCLFFEQRRWRHFGVGFDEETTAYVRALIARIAALLPEDTHPSTSA